jgi:acetoin utilization deacetylase AcuC-like enzyme/GNAT superfamily N-acetyltransferase
MFRIRRIFDDALTANRDAVMQVQKIIREQFPLLADSDIDKIPGMLRNPLKYRFKSILYIAEDFKGTVKGFALISYEPQLKFCYLDYLSAARTLTSSGIGGALYEHVREEALSLNSVGIFFECLPDNPNLCRNFGILRQNKARLRFYEKYGARPIVKTAYETPVEPGDDNPPYLVFDGLGQEKPLGLHEARRIVKTILERKYSHLCPQDYIDRVVESFVDDPVCLRRPVYRKTEAQTPVPVSGRLKKIALVVNDKHNIHHVKERGYVESPVRIGAILKELTTTSLFEPIAPKEFSEKHIRAIHDPHYFDYFKRVCKNLEPGKSVYPYVFPIRNAARPPKDLAVRAGYYCIDTFTPINLNAFLAAKRAVDCTLTAANMVLEGIRIAYSLVRPPGHHAELRSFGGFCYFNNAAIAAQYLSGFGKVAMLDIDYHHGNGQQQLFYDRSDVLTISIHGHPSFAYPYFSGFDDETGAGVGTGKNINYALPEQVDGEQYLLVLHKALRKIGTFEPTYLVVCLGLDTAKGDPTGTWSLTAKDYDHIGKAIGRMKLPTLVVQEGGYRTRAIGANARHFFVGLWSGVFQP